MSVYSTNPDEADSDDGIDDADEINFYGTSGTFSRWNGRFKTNQPTRSWLFDNLWQSHWLTDSSSGFVNCRRQ
ncbi:MAG: hypothetical protein HN348_12660 [Proteobacteria bacterium]|nr:hypothetical protein [Pseudomonadota bacterium]